MYIFYFITYTFNIFDISILSFFIIIIFNIFFLFSDFKVEKNSIVFKNLFKKKYYDKDDFREITKYFFYLKKIEMNDDKSYIVWDILESIEYK